MNLSTWGDLGNIILGITSVFTAIVTAVVLCKQHKLQQEQHKLEQEKLNFTIPVTDQPRDTSRCFSSNGRRTTWTSATVEQNCIAPLSFPSAQ